MAKMGTRSSPAKNPEHNSPLKSQGLTKNPSMELCCFTDPEVDQLCRCFPDGTIFRPFDSSMRSDCVSYVWVTFLAAPFQIGFTYLFPTLTQGFFTLTGLCYIQAMPMMWRVLYALEHIVEHEGIDIGLSELSRLYILVSHGSHRYLFKSKPQQPHPILKTTKNDTNRRNQFLFVRRDSIPNGSHLPKKWNTDAISLSHIQESPVTKERIEAFWKLDPAIRTFPPRSKDSQEISSTSYTMSSAAKSSKSASRFSVGDLQDIVSPRSIKKELAANQSNPKAKGTSTRGKGTKRKKPTESSEGLPLMERQLHDYVSEVRIWYPKTCIFIKDKGS
ncbi:hypothetical protein HanLR1_Chr02g0049001 [Helianthus annuus]|nr:hypothetical protein HanHA89_Chr02g0051241 [Helianthus annuus]KAJ0776733.1 hypothetical protein HanLR1_Chr02g0049001 [Helianthus annuus]